jgi:hypothetical protein
MIKDEGLLMICLNKTSGSLPKACRDSGRRVNVGVEFLSTKEALFKNKQSTPKNRPYCGRADYC